MMTGKKLTKLLDAGYRRRIIEQMPAARRLNYMIPQMARYIVDSCIVNRSKEHALDRKAGYGFSPIFTIGAVLKDGNVGAKLFEMNTINHFLKDEDGDSAIEVATAILVDWAKTDNNVVSFDPERVDAEFEQVETDYVNAVNEKARNEQENAENEQD